MCLGIDFEFIFITGVMRFCKLVNKNKFIVIDFFMKHLISFTMFSCVMIDCCGLQFLNWNLLQTFGNQLQFWYQVSSFKVIICTLKFWAYKKVFLNLNYKLIAVFYIEHILSQQFVCIKFSGKYQTQIWIQKFDVILCMQFPYQQLASMKCSLSVYLYI